MTLIQDTNDSEDDIEMKKKKKKSDKIEIDDD